MTEAHSTAPVPSSKPVQTEQTLPRVSALLDGGQDTRNLVDRWHLGLGGAKQYTAWLATTPTVAAASRFAPPGISDVHVPGADQQRGRVQQGSWLTWFYAERLASQWFHEP